nr:methylated-DNA--[protein]-cysteine S-methyltransferase [uncultured Peptostreptococcus sp.]
MYYSINYKSPLGWISIVADEDRNHLLGVYLEGQKNFMLGIDKKELILLGSKKINRDICIDKANEVENLGVIAKTTSWLDRYFLGEMPSVRDIKISLRGSDFRLKVWTRLMDIPYGKVETYASIAREIAKMMGKDSMSAQAVGSAIGYNPISILIPCHRVVGSSGDLTGYSGGIERKKCLLEHEGIQVRGRLVDLYD